MLIVLKIFPKLQALMRGCGGFGASFCCCSPVLSRKALSEHLRKPQWRMQRPWIKYLERIKSPIVWNGWRERCDSRRSLWGSRSACKSGPLCASSLLAPAECPGKGKKRRLSMELVCHFQGRASAGCSHKLRSFSTPARYQSASFDEFPGN